MTNLEASFLDDIKANPHDWLPRLVFADWLEEQGDERGELIRLSHELTQLQCEDRPAKEAHLQELSKAGVKWPAPKLENGLGLELILLPPGEFLMGAPKHEEDRRSYEDQVEVLLTQGFWMGENPVSQGEWKALMKTTPWTEAGIKPNRQSPASNLSWADATDFCWKLTVQEREAGRLTNEWAFHLPTEAQWEFACRAGTTTRYFFGDDLERSALNSYTCYDPTRSRWNPPDPVPSRRGQQLPNPWGIYDLQGNVLEWCRDSWSYRLPGGIDPVSCSPNAYHSLRGGCTYPPRQSMRSAARHWSQFADHLTGFRLVLCPAK